MFSAESRNKWKTTCGWCCYHLVALFKWCFIFQETINFRTDIFKLTINKKVLLRERKRHTARRVAIAISCYSQGGRGKSLDKKFLFPFWTCIKPNLVSKNFPFTVGGGGSLDQKFFFPFWTCIKANLVSKNFPFTRGWGGSLYKLFFSILNMYQAKSGVKKFSLYCGGIPRQKLFFHSEHVSSQIWCQKFFPLLGGGPLTKIFFFHSEHVSSQIWCQKFFPLLRPGPPPPHGNLTPGIPPPPKIWHLGPPPKIWDLGPLPPPSKAGSGTPPQMWTDWNYYLPPSFRWRAVKNGHQLCLRISVSPTPKIKRRIGIGMNSLMLMVRGQRKIRRVWVV